MIIKRIIVIFKMNILEVEKINPCCLPRKVNKPPRRLKEEQGKEADGI